MQRLWARPALLITPDKGLRLGLDVADHIRFHGPTTMTVPLTMDPRSVGGLRIDIAESPARDYSVRFSGPSACAAERLLKVTIGDSGTWGGEWVDDIEQPAPDCVEDNDCETWRWVAPESQCPASRICQPSSMNWQSSISVWVSSRGRCTVGMRCLLDDDCPAGLVCDASDHIYSGRTGKLFAPVCRTAHAERTVNCLPFDRECASASLF